MTAAAAEAFWRTSAIESEAARRAARAALRWTAAAAHTAKLLPRVDAVTLVGPEWSVAFIGDPYMRRQLEHALFAGEPLRHRIGSVPIWTLTDAVTRALDEVPLVVCSLPKRFPARWRPAAPLTFSTPVFVDHLMDLTVPLEEQLRGTARQEIRQLLSRARRLDISTHVTRDDREVQGFHREMLEPFQRARHGSRAMVMEYEALVARVRRPDYELVLLEYEGRVVAGTVLRFVGPEGSSDQLGMSADVPDTIARALQTRTYLIGIERAVARGCTRHRFGGSLARYTDPVFRSKRRWGARTIARDKLTHPDWTWLARDLPAPLADHLNRVGFVTFHDGKSCVVRLEAGEPASTAPRRLDGVEGYLVVSPGASRFEPFTST